MDTWKVGCKILPHYNGWVIFQFDKHEELENVLSNGPYFIYGRTLLLRTIPENFCFQDEDYSIVPVWVQLHSFPLQCWNTRAICRIASKLGKPICLDNTTQERSRISYARVLIELDTSTQPIDEFEEKLLSGIVYTQYVSYENLPKFCSHCFIFGHYMSNCKHCTKSDEENKEQTNEIHADTTIMQGKVVDVKMAEDPNNQNANTPLDSGNMTEKNRIWKLKNSEKINVNSIFS